MNKHFCMCVLWQKTRPKSTEKTEYYKHYTMPHSSKEYVAPPHCKLNAEIEFFQFFFCCCCTFNIVAFAIRGGGRGGTELKAAVAVFVCLCFLPFFFLLNYTPFCLISINEGKELMMAAMILLKGSIIHGDEMIKRKIILKKY